MSALKSMRENGTLSQYVMSAKGMETAFVEAAIKRIEQCNKTLKETRNYTNECLFSDQVSLFYSESVKEVVE